LAFGKGENDQPGLFKLILTYLHCTKGLQLVEDDGMKGKDGVGGQWACFVFIAKTFVNSWCRAAVPTKS
jgi:hypothetical protein